MVKWALLLLALLSAAACAASVPQAYALWSQGDYRHAVAAAFEPATAGDPKAQFLLGEAYRLGRSVDPDIDQARDWYSRAARQGDVASAAALGELLVHTRHAREAVPWLTLAASHEHARATALLAAIYYTGDGADPDLILATSLMKKAAALGSPEAKAKLAMMDDTAPPVDVSSPQPLAEAANIVPTSPAVRDEVVAIESPQFPRLTSSAAPGHRVAPVSRSARLQVGAFRTAGNARRAIAALASRMQDVSARYSVVHAGGFYKVLLLLDDRSGAQRASARLTAIGWQHFPRGHRLRRV